MKCFYTVIDGTPVHINGNWDEETMAAIAKMVRQLKQHNMNDNVLGHLREARAALLEERDEQVGKSSRELSISLTEIDTAILWREKDLQLKQPPKDEVAIAPIKANLLDVSVFPSEERTIMVADDPDYGGAHLYTAKKSTGFGGGKASYIDEWIDLQFVQKNLDGSMTPGLQSEQLALIMIDRTKKLNARFPSVFNDKMILGLSMFLEACKERVEDRINRGVMGDLKK